MAQHPRPRAETLQGKRLARERFLVFPWCPVVLEYLGPRGLIVRGPITKMLYRFMRTGAQAAVDRRDAYLLLARSSFRRIN